MGDWEHELDLSFSVYKFSEFTSHPTPRSQNTTPRSRCGTGLGLIDYHRLGFLGHRNDPTDDLGSLVRSPVDIAVFWCSDLESWCFDGGRFTATGCTGGTAPSWVVLIDLYGFHRPRLVHNIGGLRG